MRPEFKPGAHNAVHVCMGMRASDRVVIIEDEERKEIAGAIAEEADGTASGVIRLVLEKYGPRPIEGLPADLAAAIRDLAPTVSFFIAGHVPGEITFRQGLVRLLTEELRCRHAHMIGVDSRLMVDGMAGDYDEIYRITRSVYEVVRKAARIEVTTALGTDLVATFDPARTWIPCDGRYREPGLWGNLPEGETFTAPAGLEGMIVGEEMGDYFAPRYGTFKQPVRMRIEGCALVDFEAGDPALQADIEAYVAQHRNSRRVGEFAIGTNIGLTRIVGNFLQDEKFPGVHIAFGDPYGHLTGAGWDCPTHVDVLACEPDVMVDGRRIMARGRFLI